MDIRKSLIDVRKNYIQSIRAELLGPGSEISLPDSEHEIISSTPEVRYSIGILFPQNNKINADNDESVKAETAASEINTEEIEQVFSEEITEEKHSRASQGTTDPDEDNLDEEISLAAQNMPSSMGMTFFIIGECNTIRCNVTFGTYKKIRVPQCIFPAPEHIGSDYIVPEDLDSILYFDKKKHCFTLKRTVQKKEIAAISNRGCITEQKWLVDIAYKLCDQLAKGFIRCPHSVETELDFCKSDYIDNNKQLDGTAAKLTALRRKVADNVYSVTVMLVNDTEGVPNGINCIFQPNIYIETANNTFRFFDYSEITNKTFQDEEEQMLAMQYRKKKIYGTGLGVSLNWDINDTGNGFIESDFFPEAEIPAMNFDLPKESNLDKNTLSMKELSDLGTVSKDEILMRLHDFVNAYDVWIDLLDAKARDIDECFKTSADKNVKGCKYASGRMKDGITKLSADDNAWIAFQLANRAMYMQREQLRMQGDLATLI